MPIYKMKGSKDGLQKYRVRINFVGQDGNPKQIDRVVYGSQEAKDLEIKLRKETMEQPSERRMSIQQLYDEYMAVKKHEVRETSYEKTARVLCDYVLPYLNGYKLDKLNNQVLQKWKNKISGLKYKSKKSKKYLSIRTKQNIYSEFRTMLNYAVKMDYLSKNPLYKIGNFKEVYFETAQDKLHYYTSDQFLKYIAVARENCITLTDWGYYVFFSIAYYTGMRKGEINALKWSDIDGDILHVRRSIAQKLKGEDRETPPKNKSSYRDLQIPQPLIDVLNEHKERHQKVDGFTEEWRVCGGIECLRDTSLDVKNRKFAEQAGLPRIRIHDFRHSHASLLANEGINIQEIARRLGHSKIEITWNTYSHLYPREEERAVSILNKISLKNV